MKHFTTALAISVCLLGACATDDESADAVEATTTEVEVARVTTSDGGIYRFIEVEPGDMALVGELVEGHTSPLATDPTLERLSYVDMYKKLTSSPVPRALLDAQARLDSQPIDTSPDTSGLVNEASGPPGPIAAITASQFAANYCWNGWDFSYCWPSTFGNPHVQRKAYSMFGHAAGVSHIGTMRLRAKKHATSAWKSSVSTQLLPGKVYYAWATYHGYRRWRRFEVIDNAGFEVRYALVGSD